MSDTVPSDWYWSDITGGCLINHLIAHLLVQATEFPDDFFRALGSRVFSYRLKSRKVI